MTTQEAIAAERKLLLQTYDRYPILFTGGHDVYLTNAEGNDYLDLLSGIGCSALGYSNGTLQQAIAQQAATLLHTSNLFYHPGTAELALRLTEISGMDRVFLCNSGTEAWEAALKVARAFAEHTRSHPESNGGRQLGTRFLALEHSFHGRTIGSVATTQKLAYRMPFAPVMPNVEFVRFNDVDDLREKFTAGSGIEICGVCIEVIQGEGGIHPVSEEFLRTARELCDSTGALLLADEIQCGFGRTGTWFAYQRYGVQPDITTVAKPLAGGLPIGAMLCTERAASAISPGMHGTTFGGNPLACATAIAVIDEVRATHLLEHVTEVGDYFLAQARALAAKHPAIVDVRGAGLMLGIELNSADLAKAAQAEMLQQRIIINRTSDTVLRFLPPYVIEREHVDTALAALDQILTQHEQAAAEPVGASAHG